MSIAVQNPQNSDRNLQKACVPVWMLVTGAAMAGGLGWGIRGQYGHETGAMMACLLVAMVLGLWLLPRLPSVQVIRALALATIAGGFGGSMTYGQTLGLTQDAPLVGNWAAWWWGILGTFLKGGLWIAFFGAFLGIGLSGKAYKPSEMAAMTVFSVFVLFLGVGIFNEPFQPDEKLLPMIYFSDSWRWEPDSELVPRRERWGGLILVLALWLVYTLFDKKDRFPLKLAVTGFLAGGFGFAGGQCLQSFHAWNPDFLGDLNQNINWWNFMETTFGMIWGGGMALGLWRSRRFIAADEAVADSRNITPSPVFEWGSLIIYSLALLVWNFGSFRYFDGFADLAWTMLMVPMVMVCVGRIWPVAFLSLVVLLPIAGKTILQMAYKTDAMSALIAWPLLGVLPLVVGVIVFFRMLRVMDFKPKASVSNVGPWAVSTIILVLLYHALNFVFFEYPWPWSPWTSRTPNEIVFLVFSAGIMIVSLWAVIRMGGALQRNARLAQPSVPIPTSPITDTNPENPES